jgi:hypothetical protein
MAGQTGSGAMDVDWKVVDDVAQDDADEVREMSSGKKNPVPTEACVGRVHPV